MNSFRCPGVPRETVRADLVIDDVSKYLLYAIFFSRFFETESIAVIAMMILKYRIEVKEEPEFIGETFEERFARITASKIYLTNTYANDLTSSLGMPEFSCSPSRVPLVFRRR